MWKAIEHRKKKKKIDTWEIETQEWQPPVQSINSTIIWVYL